MTNQELVVMRLDDKNKSEAYVAGRTRG